MVIGFPCTAWDSGSDTRQGAKERRKKMELKDLMKRKRGRVPDWDYNKKIYLECVKWYAVKGISKVRVNWMISEKTRTPGDPLYKSPGLQTEQAVRNIYIRTKKALEDGTITL